MTETTCLHIQDRESGPIRVVELAWISVRIGRAAHCEVRLTGPDLPEEICRLQRRGQSWRLLPAVSDSPIFLEGRRLGGPCLLPFGMPFRAGEYCFTLRYNRAAEPDWDLYAGPAPPREGAVDKPPVAEVEPDPSPVPPNTASPKAPIRRIAVKPLLVEKRPDPKLWDSPPPPSRERWETRWKALGAQVKAREDSKRKTPEISRPAYQSELEPIPLREAHVPLIQVPAITRPAQELLRERVAHGAPMSISMDSTEVPDLEQHSAGLPQKLLVEETPVTSVWGDEPEARTDDPVVQTDEQRLTFIPVLLRPELIEDVQSALEPIAMAPISSLKSELQEAVEDADERPFASNDQPSASVSSADAVQDDPVVEVPPISAEELPARAPFAQVIRDDPLDEPLPMQAAPSPVSDLEWPSAKDILATCRPASPGRLPPNGGKKAAKKINRSSVMPTMECVPFHWNPPISVAGPIAALFILAAGLLGCPLSWSWAQDSYSASIVTDRLMTGDPAVQRTPLPETIQPPAGGWISSTPGHLANWAVFLGRLAAEENQSPAETVALLERALAASPVNAQARFALAQLEPADGTQSPRTHSVGLSRDSASLAWSAHRLLTAGRKDEALKLFGRALSVAIPEKVTRFRAPRFSEDPGVRRYLLPGEEQVREIVAELVSQNVWTFEEWSRALPESPIVLIATARLLRERGRGEAEKLLDIILKERAIPLDPVEAGPVTLAAHAEAFALRSRFKESGQLYRRAIESIDDSTIRRSWWFNLAEIAYQSDDEIERQAALRSATAVAFSDDITRRATDIQRATQTRSTGVKAN
jgi:tetratricopeptide (TPR) repeat protein